jgi:hypothetical protein
VDNELLNNWEMTTFERFTHSKKIIGNLKPLAIVNGRKWSVSSFPFLFCIPWQLLWMNLWKGTGTKKYKEPSLHDDLHVKSIFLYF